MLDLDRITHPLRLAAGSHQPGSGKGCAMNVISYITGDTKITDFPECSARPLARMVQSLNDRIAGADGYLSPENSVIVLDLGWLTVGTAGAAREVVWQWLADLLVDPEHGVVRFARRDGVAAIQKVAELCARRAAGRDVSVEEWQSARNADADAATNADAYEAAYAAAYAAANTAATAYATTAAAAYANAYANAATAAAAYAATDATAAALAVTDANAATDAAAIEFTRWVITHWRDLAGLDIPTDINAEAVDSALTRIG